MKKHTISQAKPVIRAAVIHLELPSDENRGLAYTDIHSLRQIEEKLAEAVNLTAALGVKIVFTQAVNLKKVTPKSLMGKGKLEEYDAIFTDKEVDVVVLNCAISPGQQRNLENAWQIKVIDRTQLILEIFADRAHTKAGRLQVELASQLYQQSRLVRTWTHLERQRGGLGKTGGPGERQIELDRRMLRDRIKLIREELTHVQKERELQRKSRKKSGLPVVALVGYTNAGKSIVFNALLSLGKEEKLTPAMVKNMLFATLDPLMRKLKLPSGREVIISDTVGFISDLPHELVDAFASTLEEVALADIILHIQDVSNPEVAAQAADVEQVLQEIGANEIPCINVANKIDLVEENDDSSSENDAVYTAQNLDAKNLGGKNSLAIKTSAATGQGLAELCDTIETHFAQEEITMTLEIPAADGKKLAWLYQNAQIIVSNLDGDVYSITARLPKRLAGEL